MATKTQVLGDMWDVALSFLPEDLDSLARSTGAITRPRKVEGAAQLLRAFLLYVHVGSYRTAAGMAKNSGLLDITSEGLFYRLSKAEGFLEALLLKLTTPVAPVGYRLLLVDATSVSGPRSDGTDFRVHIGYDPDRGVPSSIHVGDGSVGERLSLHDLQPGCLVVGDRAYGTARNVHAAHEAGADVLARVTKGQLRLYHLDGTKMDWSEATDAIPRTGAKSLQLRLPVPPDGVKRWYTKHAKAWHDVRLVGARDKDGDVVWLVTNMTKERLPDKTATELYRVRWQVELYFKRLKSLGDLDVLGSRDGPTAKASLLAKLVLLVLTSLLSEEQAFSPYGYPVRQAEEKPLATVRLRLEAPGEGAASYRKNTERSP